MSWDTGLALTKRQKLMKELQDKQTLEVDGQQRNFSFTQDQGNAFGTVLILL
jgi:hypothetical protein